MPPHESCYPLLNVICLCFLLFFSCALAQPCSCAPANSPAQGQANAHAHARVRVQHANQNLNTNSGARRVHRHGHGGRSPWEEIDLDSVVVATNSRQQRRRGQTQTRQRWPRRPLSSVGRWPTGAHPEGTTAAQENGHPVAAAAAVVGTDGTAISQVMPEELTIKAALPVRFVPVPDGVATVATTLLSTTTVTTYVEVTASGDADSLSTSAPPEQPLYSVVTQSESGLESDTPNPASSASTDPVTAGGAGAGAATTTAAVTVAAVGTHSSTKLAATTTATTYSSVTVTYTQPKSYWLTSFWTMFWHPSPHEATATATDAPPTQATPTVTVNPDGSGGGGGGGGGQDPSLITTTTTTTTSSPSPPSSTGSGSGSINILTNSNDNIPLQTSTLSTSAFVSAMSESPPAPTPANRITTLTAVITEGSVPSAPVAAPPGVSLDTSTAANTATATVTAETVGAESSVTSVSLSDGGSEATIVPAVSSSTTDGSGGEKSSTVEAPQTRPNPTISISSSFPPNTNPTTFLTSTTPNPTASGTSPIPLSTSTSTPQHSQLQLKILLPVLLLTLLLIFLLAFVTYIFKPTLPSRILDTVTSGRWTKYKTTRADNRRIWRAQRGILSGGRDAEEEESEIENLRRKLLDRALARRERMGAAMRSNRGSGSQGGKSGSGSREMNRKSVGGKTSGSREMSEGGSGSYSSWRKSMGATSASTFVGAGDGEALGGLGPLRTVREI